MTEEPSDEECEAIAMLTGYHFQRNFRYEGRKFLQRRTWGAAQGRVAKRYVEYLDPVTLEVIGEQSVSDHYSMLNMRFKK